MQFKFKTLSLSSYLTLDSPKNGTILGLQLNINVSPNPQSGHMTAERGILLGRISVYAVEQIFCSSPSTNLEGVEDRVGAHRMEYSCALSCAVLL